MSMLPDVDEQGYSDWQKQQFTEDYTRRIGALDFAHRTLQRIQEIAAPPRAPEVAHAPTSLPVGGLPGQVQVPQAPQLPGPTLPGRAPPLPQPVPAPVPQAPPIPILPQPAPPPTTVTFEPQIRAPKTYTPPPESGLEPLPGSGVRTVEQLEARTQFAPQTAESLRVGGGGPPPQEPTFAEVPATVGQGRNAFISGLGAAARQVESESGIPASVLLAIPANETGWGQAVAGNNLYGIKGSNPRTGANTGPVSTWEDYGAGPVTIRDTFRAYDNPIESMRDFVSFLRDNPRYAPALRQFGEDQNPAALVANIKAAGYATDPSWAAKVNQIRQGIESDLGSLAPPSARPTAQPGATAMAQSQFGDPQLTTDEAYAACGPAAAVRFAQAYGRNPTLREAVDLAKQVGWTPGAGMAGITSEQKLLHSMGVETKLVAGPQWTEFAKEAQTGNPITISTPGHYFYADSFNPQTGAFHVGRSGLDLKQGAEWMTPGQMEGLMGQAQGALFASNPTVQAPSTAVSTVEDLDAQRSLNVDALRAHGGGASVLQQLRPFQAGTAAAAPSLRQLDRAVEVAHQAPARPAAADMTRSEDPLGSLGNTIGNAIQSALSSALGGGGPPGDRSRDTLRQRAGQPAEIEDLSLQPWQHLTGLKNPVTGEDMTSELGLPDLTPPRSIEEAVRRASEDALRRGLPSPGPGGQLGILDPKLGSPFENPEGVLGISDLLDRLRFGGRKQQAIADTLETAFEAERGAGGGGAGLFGRRIGDLGEPIGSLLPANRHSYTPPAEDVGPLERAFRRLTYEFTDRNVGLNQLQERFQEIYRRENNGQELPPEQMVAFLNRLTPGGAAHVMAEEGLGAAVRSVEPHTNSLTDVLDARAAVSTAEALGRRTERELLARGVPAEEAAREGQRVADERVFAGGVRLADARRVLDELPKRLTPQAWQRVSNAADAVGTHRDNLLERLVNADVLSREGADYLKREYPDWVKTRVLAYMQDDSPSGLAAGSRIGVADNGLRRYTLGGSELASEHPLNSMISETDSVESLARRNETARALVELDQQAAEPQLRRVVSPTEYRQLEDAGEDMARYTTTIGPEDRTLNFFREGERQKYVTSNPFYAEAIQGADMSNLPTFARKPADFIRMAATARNPAFLAANALLDIPTYTLRTAAEGGPGGAMPWEVARNTAELIGGYADAFKGLNPYFTRGGGLGTALGGAAGYLGTDENDPNRGTKIAAAAALGGLIGGRRAVTGRFEGEATQRYLRQGGGMAGQFRAFEPKAAAERLAEMRRSNVFEVKDIGDLKRIVAGFAKLKWVEAIGQRVELGPRVAAMKVAERRGANPVQATIAGRDVTVDFDRGGRFVKFLNQFVPFLNVGFQGSAQLFRIARQNPGGMAAAVGSMIVAPTFAAEAWNNQNEQMANDYADVPQYLKDSGIVMMIPTDNVPVDQNGNRRPPFVYINMREFAPFVIAARGAAERMLGNKTPRDARELAGSTFLAAMPMQARSISDLVGRLNPIPQAKTALQLSTNQDFYRGSTIVSERADQNASPLSKFLTPYLQRAMETLDPNTQNEARPSAIDFIIRDTAAGLGDALLGGSRIAAGEQRPDLLSEKPIIGGVAGRFIRSSIGQELESARGEVITPSARRALREAGIQWTPSPVSPVTRNVPLRQEEQARLQRLTNQYVDQAIQKAVRREAWQRAPQDKKEKYLNEIVGNARDRATVEVLRSIPRASRIARQKSGSAKD
jgi:hypothetical protein